MNKERGGNSELGQFEQRALDRLAEMQSAAEAATETLGLPSEAVPTVLKIMFGEGEDEQPTNRVLPVNDEADRDG